jgi:hypothetical protein
LQRAEELRNAYWTPWALAAAQTPTVQSTDPIVIDWNACESSITVRPRATYPFVPGPSIDYSITFKFKVVMDGTVTITLHGWHDAFPDYDGYVDERIVYSRLSPASGPGLNLVTWRRSIRMSGNGMSVLAKTPAGCPCKGAE